MAKRDEYGMTTNQRAFADEYIANNGNGTQAYLKAYPNIRSEATARVNASKLLTNTNVSEYIAKRTNEKLKKANMKNDEVIARLVAIARREPFESYSKKYDHLENKVVKEITYTLQPTIEESTRALETLVKMLGLNDINNDLIRRKLIAEIEKTEALAVMAKYEADKMTDNAKGQQSINQLIEIGKNLLGDEDD